MTESDVLLHRIANGRTDLVWECVAQGISIDASIDGATPLGWSAYYGDVSALRFLLEQGGSLGSLGDNFGLTAAAFHGHWRLVEFLLEAGAKTEYADPETGETALHAALCTPQRERHDLVVDVLIAEGADPNTATTPGVATGCFMRDCKTRGETSLHRAAAFGSVHTIQLLRGAGAQLDAKDANGDTALGWASWYARPDSILRLLLYAEHSIHPQRKPMAESLLGVPLRPKNHQDT